MKILICYLFLSVGFSIGILAQSTTSVVEDLNTHKSGQGMVKVYVDDNVKPLLNGQDKSEIQNPGHTFIDSTKKVVSPGTFVKQLGYRVQIFSGNDQRKSKNEAYYKQGLMRNMFPNVPTFVSFNAPFWKLRAGNYKTYGEAAHAMSEIKSAFPSFGKEIYIVRDMVKVLVQ